MRATTLMQALTAIAEPLKVGHPCWVESPTNADNDDYCEDCISYAVEVARGRCEKDEDKKNTFSTSGACESNRPLFCAECGESLLYTLGTDGISDEVHHHLESDIFKNSDTPITPSDAHHLGCLFLSLRSISNPGDDALMLERKLSRHIFDNCLTLLVFKNDSLGQQRPTILTSSEGIVPSAFNALALPAINNYLPLIERGAYESAIYDICQATSFKRNSLPFLESELSGFEGWPKFIYCFDVEDKCIDASVTMDSLANGIPDCLGTLMRDFSVGKEKRGRKKLRAA